MDKTDLIDQLLDRVEQLQDIMNIQMEHYDISPLLLESIATHADEATIMKIIEDIETSVHSHDPLV